MAVVRSPAVADGVRREAALNCELAACLSHAGALCPIRNRHVSTVVRVYDLAGLASFEGRIEGYEASGCCSGQTLESNNCGHLAHGRWRPPHAGLRVICPISSDCRLRSWRQHGGLAL